MNNNANMRALSVSDVNRYIKSLMNADEVLSAITLRGEISNFKAHTSGHMYFTLKDEGAEIAAVMFRADASRLSFRPSDGMKVVVFGSVDVYERSGRYQVYVRTMIADGIGAMAQAYERLKKKLEAEGLFAPERKRPLPAYPSCVGVITAPTGAAIRDIINITGRRYPQAKILLYPALVQGAEAPASLCAGLEYLNADGECDVIILGRGGGSIEDLWAFNDEKLTRTVAASRIPVISAVGHETDFTLCDFAADRRAPTPSAAAEIAVPDRYELLARMDDISDRLETRLLQGIEVRRNRILSRLGALEKYSPEQKLARARQRVAYAENNMDRAINRKTEQRRDKLSAYAARLDSLSPLAVLSRGYSALKDERGRIVASVDGLCVGDTVTIMLSDGSARSQICSAERYKNTED